MWKYFLIMVALVLSLTACGSGESSQSEGEGSTAQKNSYQAPAEPGAPMKHTAKELKQDLEQLNKTLYELKVELLQARHDLREESVIGREGREAQKAEAGQ